MWCVYRIFYNNDIVYVGRTNDLTRRMSQHFRSLDIDIDKVSKIEYVELESEADMNLYELYYILKLKPQLNSKDFARDELHYDLPELHFIEFYSHLFESVWPEAVRKKKEKLQQKQQRKLILENIVKNNNIELKDLAQQEYVRLSEV